MADERTRSLARIVAGFDRHVVTCREAMASMSNAEQSELMDRLRGGDGVCDSVIKSLATIGYIVVTGMDRLDQED